MKHQCTCETGCVCLCAHTCRMVWKAEAAHTHRVDDMTHTCIFCGHTCVSQACPACGACVPARPVAACVHAHGVYLLFASSPPSPLTTHTLSLICRSRHLLPPLPHIFGCIKAKHTHGGDNLNCVRHTFGTSPGHMRPAGVSTRLTHL
jgi:hypothetical protein